MLTVLTMEHDVKPTSLSRSIAFNDRPHYRQSNGYHMSVLLSVLICFGLLMFFFYSLCIDELSFIFISFVGLMHALLIFSFAIYQCRKSNIIQMMNEDQHRDISLNVVSKDDAFDATNLILTQWKICSFIIFIAGFIDEYAIDAIRAEQLQGHQQMENGTEDNDHKYIPI